MKKFLLFVFALITFPLAAQHAEKRERKDIERIINLGGEYFKKAEYSKALELSKRALVRSFRVDDDYLISHSYNSIGVIFDEFSESARAIEFYNKALEHAKLADNDSLKDWVYSNLGSAYYYSHIDVRKGIEYYKESLVYATKIRDSSQICYTKLNIASAYFSIDEFERGAVYMNQARPYVLSKGEPEARMSLLTLDAMYQSHHKRNAEAEANFTKALAIAKSEGMTSFEASLYENMVSHFKDAGKKAETTRYQAKYDSLTKQLYPEDQHRTLQEAAQQIELDEYRNQLSKIEADNDLQHRKIRETKLLTLLFGVILMFVLLYAYTLYRNNSNKKRLNAELTQTNEELRKAKEAAEEISRLKTQFVSTISHELRTPLYGVIGITDMFLEKHKELLDDNQVNSLKFSARYLLSLVNDVLQLNKMEDRKIKLQHRPFSIRRQMDTIANSLQFIADKNGNAIYVEVANDIPENVVGDELRLSQILINLISNALKFTKNGQVRISAKKLERGDDYCRIRFTVSDNGVGIPQKDQLRVFERFVQIDRKEGDYQGTGLGLAIVKRLLDIFGSEIDLYSEEGQGTTFRFDIDFGMNCEDNATAFADNHTEIGPLNVLVVEDNKINQMVSQHILHRFGHKCDLTDSGYEALEMVEKNKYDLILMDINMPDINGYQTSIQMRKKGISIPIIALTAFDRNEVKDEADAAGINGIIVKPFDSEEFLKLIYQTVKKPVV